MSRFDVLTINSLDIKVATKLRGGVFRDVGDPWRNVPMQNLCST